MIDEIFLSITPEEQKITDNQMLVAKKIYERLKELNLSKTDFANKMGKTVQEVSKWLRGDHNFTLNILTKIEYHLGVTLIEKDEETSKELPVLLVVEFNKPTQIFFDAGVEQPLAFLNS